MESITNNPNEETKYDLSEELTDNPENNRLKLIYYYGLYPLHKFLLKKFDIDIKNVFKNLLKNNPTLGCDLGSYNIDIVDNNYNNELDEEHNDNITFLLNCVNISFNAVKIVLKDNMGDYILHPYHFQLDTNKNLELILIEDDIKGEYVKYIDDNIKIGIIFHI